jgi:hypothetical protein
MTLEREKKGKEPYFSSFLFRELKESSVVLWCILGAVEPKLFQKTRQRSLQRLKGLKK